MDKEAKSVGKPISNLERLQSHLEEGTLAAKLVAAGLAATATDLQASLREVIRGRIDELRREHERDTHQED
jgi:hypothetical protein